MGVTAAVAAAAAAAVVGTVVATVTVVAGIAIAGVAGIDAKVEAEATTVKVLAPCLCAWTCTVPHQLAAMLPRSAAMMWTVCTLTRHRCPTLTSIQAKPVRQAHMQCRHLEAAPPLQVKRA